jgi:hypothetical protein
VRRPSCLVLYVSHVYRPSPFREGFLQEGVGLRDAVSEANSSTIFNPSRSVR